MNKKLFAIIALGATAAGALATGMLGDTVEFVRASKPAGSELQQTKTARTTPLRAPRLIDATKPNSATTLADEPTEILKDIPKYGAATSDFIVVNPGNDYSQWYVSSNGWDFYSYFELETDYYDGADDWVFIPIEIPADGGKLSLSLLATSSYSDGWNMKVHVGSEATPEAMTTQLLSLENYGTSGVTSSSAQPSTGSANVSTGGSAYLGIHGVSKTGYKLRVRNINLTCEAGSSEPAPAGEVFGMHPTQEEFDNCIVFDGNNDDCKIVYDVHNGIHGEFYDWPIYYDDVSTAFTATADADEWIITPVVHLTETARLYTASIEAQTMSTGMTESFRIVLAKSNTLEGVRAGKVIMNEPNVTNTDYEKFESKFGIAEAGDYYVAIHINSKLDRGWRIALRNLSISLTDISSDLPEVVDNLTITPDAEGALEATVKFDMPKTYINGANIPATENIDAVVVTPAETVTVSAKAGESVTRTVKAAEGVNTVTITTKNANGEGMMAKSSVTCGADVPSNPVATAKVSDDNMSLEMTWEPVTVGENGGIVPQKDLVYNIYKFVDDGQTGQWVAVKRGLKERKFSFSGESAAQQLYQVMVSAQNSRGESSGDIESYASAILGKPHEMPINETFPGQSMIYDGLLIDYPDETYTAQWALDAPSAVGATGGPECALMCLVAEVGGEGGGYAELPKFTTKGCVKPRIKLLTYISSATPTTTVRLHSTEGRGNGVTLGTIDTSTGEGWCEVVYEIPQSYYNKGWAVISLDVDCQYAGQVFILGAFDIYESVANDLAVTRPTIASYILLGQDAPFSALVKNVGTASAKTPELKAELLADGQVVAKPALDYTSATLAENETATYSGTLRFDNGDAASKDYSLVFTLPNSDSNDNNNSATANFRVGAGNMPIAYNLGLKGLENHEGVTLQWTNPHAEGYVETFEGYEHGTYAYNIGEWKNMDCDLATTYYSDGYDIPGAGEPKAFQVVNSYLSNMLGMYQPSGDSFLMAFCAQGTTADDWFISPEVKGGSTVKFYMTSLSSLYVETLEVLTSSTDDELDSFNNVAQTVVAEMAGWQIVTVTLPEDAKYFALHYISKDMFGICIDDITFAPVAPSIEITGWNVYRDGNLIKENVSECSFTDRFNLDENATYRYNVAAVGTMGGKTMVFPMSNTLEFSYAAIGDITADGNWTVTADHGTVSVDGCEGLSVEIVDIRGIKQFSVAEAPAHVSTSLLPGVYVVTVDGRSRKVIVR